METNIYYQLAQTECALDRCKARLFKKNLTIFGMAAMIYILAKAGLQATKKQAEAEKARDALAEEHDKVLYELNLMKRTEAGKSFHCDGHATLTND